MDDRCKTCRHGDLRWDEEPCESCCGANDGYEPRGDRMDELISRKAAIAAIEGADWYAQNKNNDMVLGAYDEEDAWYKAQDVYKVLEDLPPAIPDQIKYNIENFNKEDWERLEKEWRNAPITVLPAQPEPKRGKWIKTARWGRVYYCDQCRNYLDFDGVNAGRGSTNFCPNCGAKMEEE